MNEPGTVEDLVQQAKTADDRQSSVAWTIASLFTFVVACVVAYRPSFDSPLAVFLAVLPFLVLLGVEAIILQPFVSLPAGMGEVATVVALAGWSVLMINDESWLILTFAIYTVCFWRDRWEGLFLAGIVSTVWAVAWLLDGSPIWTILIPAGIFMVGVLVSNTISRSEVVNAQQASLIRQLQETRDELAASERSKGVLQERARFASEIHDTLAQGFTSIVLLSRAAQRTGELEEGMSTIEETAQENLQAARRLVDALRPPELDTASLPDALERQIAASLPSGIRSEFRVVGEPRQLSGNVEVTLLRAVQEALLNISTHAEAEHVDITLSYLDDVVALDVRDDGVGFAAGSVSDRGSLTGGQGLKVLESRTWSLAGELTLEAADDGGSILSIQLPATAP